MIAQSVTIQMPLPLYDRLKQRAQESHTSIEDQVLELVTAAVPVTTELQPELEAELSLLVLLDDDTLWRAARSHLPQEIASRLQDLHMRRQREGLVPAEESEPAADLKLYERAMLIRAQAAALLSQRGLDVSSLLDVG